MSPTTSSNCEHCPDHRANDQRIASIESKLDVVENNTLIVNRLSTRVNMLIALLSIGTLVVLGGTVYTFTAVSEFRGEYGEHRIALTNDIHSSQQQTVDRIESKMKDMEQRIDKKLDTLSGKVAKLEATVERTSQ